MTAKDIGADLCAFAVRYNQRACGANHALLSSEKLAGACGRPFQTFDGIPLTPRVAQRAAMILDAVNQAHAFRDGNKRTAWMCMIYFLDRSGFTIEDVDDEEAESLVLDVVTHQVAIDVIERWISDKLIIRS